MPRLAPVIKTVLFSMFIPFTFLILPCAIKTAKTQADTRPRSLHLVRFQKTHVGAHDAAVALCPAAHASEWSDDCPSQFGQGILDSNGLRSRYAPGDQSSGFEIAKSSGQHTLGDASKPASQLPVPIRPLFQRKQDLGCPPADEKRGGRFRSWHRVHSVLPPTKTSWRIDRSNSPFTPIFRHSPPPQLASPCVPGAIRNTCVPGGVLVPICKSTSATPTSGLAGRV